MRQIQFPSGDLARFTLTLLLAAVVLTAGHGQIVHVLNLYPDTLPANPRFVFDGFLLLYLVAPLTIVAAIVLLLAPGALLVVLLGADQKPTEMLLKAFIASFALRFGCHAMWKLSGGTVTPAAFVGLDATLLTMLGVLLWIRSRRSGAVVIRLSAPERWQIVRLFAVPYMFVVVFIPEIFWKDMIGDGFETLYSGYTLADHIITRFSTPSGYYGIGLGLMSQAYPVSWFGNLFGFAEPAARLPLALYAMLIAAGVMALVEWQATRRLHWSEEVAIAVAVVAFVATLGFNSSYNSYAADFAAPLAVEALTVLCILSLIFMWWSGQHVWFLAYALLGNFNRPNILLVLGALIVATLVVRGNDWRRAIAALTVAVVVCLLLNAAYEKVYLPRATSLPVEGMDGSILRRVRYLQFNDFQRILYLLIPSGILPALALLAYKYQDAYARQISILVLLYFGVFYVETYYSLHHFAPIMVLPLVVFWRLLTNTGRSSRLTAAALVGAMVAIGVAFPWGKPLPQQTQRLARQIDVRLSDFEPVAIGANEGSDLRAAMEQIFPPQWRVDNLARTWGFDVHAVAYYAQRFSELDRGRRDLNYRFQDAAAPVPEGWQHVTTRGSVAAFVRDQALWRQQLDHVPSTVFASPVYRIRREQLLRYLGLRQHIHQVDLRDVYYWAVGAKE